MFAIFTTLAMQEKGTYQLIFLKTRTAAAVGQKIDLAYDPESMRITGRKTGEGNDNPERPATIASLRAELAVKAAKPKEDVKTPALPAEDGTPASNPRMRELMARLKKTRLNATS